MRALLLLPPRTRAQVHVGAHVHTRAHADARVNTCTSPILCIQLPEMNVNKLIFESLQIV